MSNKGHIAGNSQPIIHDGYCTTAELASFLQRPIKSILRLAGRENWQFEKRQERGGGRLWLISSMPPSTRQAVIYAIIRSANSANDIEPEHRGSGRGQVAIPKPVSTLGIAGGNETADPINLYRTIQKNNQSVNSAVDCGVFNGESERAVAGDMLPVSGLPISQGFSIHPGGQPGPLALPPKQLIPQHQLTDKQRQVMDARLAIVAEVNKLSAITGKKMAILAIVKSARLGQLPANLQSLVPIANDKRKSKHALSDRTLYNWCALAKDGHAALAPGYKLPDMRVPGWLPEFMKFYQQPQNPGLPEAYRDFCNEWPNKPPSIYQVRRYLEKISVVDKNRGRVGPRDLKSIQPFVRRDTSKLFPCDVYTADGHTFDAEIQHPDNGRPFRPEVTIVMDAATRKVVGFSITLSENALAVIDALNMAVKTSGVCSIFYVDRGKGYVNEILKAPGVGLVDRLGMTITHSLPYNSQARGIVERGHRTVLVSLARTMATYVNKAMDTEAKQIVFKITRKQMKQAGHSGWLMSWEDFRTMLARHVEDYNDRPHSSLPKIWDEKLNKRRHLSPNEMLFHFVSNGWEPMMLSDDEASDLFRPYQKRVVSRGEVRLLNNIYFDTALADFHGEVVRVGFDVADPAQVYVRNNEGRLICVAKLNANRRDYFAKSFLEQANEKRRKGQEKRHEQKLANMRSTMVVDAEYSEEELAEKAKQVEQYMATLPEPEAQETSSARPQIFWESDERYRWLANHRDEWNESDPPWLQDYIASSLYKEFREIYQREGIAWEQINPNPKLKETHNA